MSRALRIQYPGCWYHVMNRGANYQTIFNNDDHRLMFLELLGEISQRYSIEIHTYCLMDNHYHLLLKINDLNLSEAMHHVNSNYARGVNRLMKREGPLFRGRFKAIMVGDDHYAMELSRYIHINPVKAGIVAHAGDYKWSSCSSYLNSTNQPDWLNINKLKSFFNTEYHSASNWMVVKR